MESEQQHITHVSGLEFNEVDLVSQIRGQQSPNVLLAIRNGRAVERQRVCNNHTVGRGCRR